MDCGTPSTLVLSLKEISMRTDEKILRIRDLCVDYRTDLETVHAVNGISFDIEKGETLGIVGETGAGKTTTAISILRLLPERTGKVINGSYRVLWGRTYLEARKKRMRDIRGEKIAMNFQDPMTSLNPVLSVGEQNRRGTGFSMPLKTKKR